ncbi:HCP-like protein [Russula compacta]|nr:HCP-like protein [Russula compacta]
MVSKRHVPSRKRMWLAWGIIALGVASGSAQDSSPQAELSHGSSMTTSLTVLGPLPSGPHTSLKGSPSDADAANEAARAYKQALATLATLTALPLSSAYETHHQISWHTGNSILSSILPNPQGQGPLGSAIRIAIRLRHQSWLPRFLSSRLSQDSGRLRSEEEMNGRAIKVIDLLQHAADLGHLDALFALGKISLLPPTPHFTADPVSAYKTFDTHASLTGNATSQGYLAFFHATGYQNIVPVDQAKAQLYYTFAAHGGDRSAQMGLGYRYWTGIGVVEDCESAAEWYSAAAEQVMARFLSGPPGGRTLPLTPARLSDLAGGVYGPGASVASTGMNGQRPAIKAARARAAGETWEDILEYYIFNADRGETDFAFRLGKIFYHGSIYNAPGGIASGGEGVGRVPWDLERARYYFESIARQVWPSDSGDAQGRRDENSPVGLAAPAAGYLGRMYLRGEGVRVDLKLARMWFERGATHGDKECHNGLGIIWRDGLIEGRKDSKKALAHFTIAAGQDLAEAQVNLGKHYYDRGDLKLAISYFEAAMRHGSPLESFYYLAKIQATQMKNMPTSLRPGACSIAVSFFKVVTERGSWDDDLIREGEEAWETGTSVGKQLAMLRWWIAAERGYEIGQNNLAYILDQDKSMFRRIGFAKFFPSNDTARLALTQWTRSAAQNNVDALVKVGDYYYYGLGVPNEPENVRWEKAAGYYQSAADTQISALAMWNLGWMYEHGYGVLQDFHLAKRHYDIALETNVEAYLPVTLSLFRLHARSLWHTLTGREGGLSIWSNNEVDSDSDQIAGRRELDEGPVVAGGSAPETDDDLLVEDDGPWYMGKAREEFNRRMRGAAAPGDDEDPVQWARDRRNAELDRDSEFGPEDMFDAALRGGHRGNDEGDEFVETMMLVVLCLIVSLLLYIRGRWIERLRREEQQQRQQLEQREERDNGLFPPPGDPARDDWAVAR